MLLVGVESREGDDEARAGLHVILLGSALSAGYALLAKTRLVAEEASAYFRVGSGASGVSVGLSFALIGAGHLVGLSVGMAMLLGLSIAWVFLVPWLTARAPQAGSAAEWAGAVFTADVRFFGAGVIGVAAIWTLLRIAGPVAGGVRSALAASRTRSRGEALALEERDIPFPIVLTAAAATLVPIAILLWSTLAGGPLAPSAPLLVAGAVLFVAVIGLVIAAVCGYMAGLIGASNSPVSGIGILSVLAAALLLAALFSGEVDATTGPALAAYALIVTGVVFGVATISNDNLQDLKTGQLVGATPWKQQLALLLGVAFGSAVIPPVLDLLNGAFGFAGTPGAGVNALPAPQAALISSLARGVLCGTLNWAMIGWGALAGAALIALDEALGRARRLRLPPLAVGIGVYLPMAVTLPVVIGAVLGRFYDRWADRRPDARAARRMGVLAATGMIVGESLFGVAFAGLVGATGSDAPLALAGGFETPAILIGLLAFAGALAFLYRFTMRRARL